MSKTSNSFHRFMLNHLVQAVGAACFTAFVGLFATTLIGRLLFNNETAQLICGSIGATILAAGAARQSGRSAASSVPCNLRRVCVLDCRRSNGRGPDHCFRGCNLAFHVRNRVVARHCLRRRRASALDSADSACQALLKAGSSTRTEPLTTKVM